MPDLAIRVATTADAAALAELATRTFREAFGADNRPEDLAQHLATSYGPVQQERELASPDITTLLVEVQATRVAFAQLRRGPAPACVIGERPLEIWRFYVAQEWHGQGVAPRLMQRVEEEARAVGAQTLWLGVWERNPRGRAFYRKCGFVDVGAQVFTVGQDAQTDRVMMRTL